MPEMMERVKMFKTKTEPKLGLAAGSLEKSIPL
jgi:hypothetical protein